MEQGYYYLTTHEGHRSIVGIGERGTWADVQGERELIVDRDVVAYLEGTR